MYNVKSPFVKCISGGNSVLGIEIYSVALLLQFNEYNYNYCAMVTTVYRWYSYSHFIPPLVSMLTFLSHSVISNSCI
jgi:hypothetical protein